MISVASDEYAECTVKAHFLIKKTSVEFDILEAILWDSGYQHLERHLQRLADLPITFSIPMIRQA